MGLLLSFFIVILDQTAKASAVKYLMDKRPIEIVKNFIELHFVRNYGAAFGILQNQRWFFITITTIVIAGMIFFMLKNKNKLTSIAKISIAMLVGGAVGNLIDRWRLGYVVDFIKVDLQVYNFPVFNVADIFIVLGTALLVFTVVFDKIEQQKGDNI